MDIEPIVTFKPRRFYEVASYKVCSDQNPLKCRYFLRYKCSLSLYMALILTFDGAILIPQFGIK